MDAKGTDGSSYDLLSIKDRTVFVRSSDPFFSKKYVVASSSFSATFEDGDSGGADALSGRNLLVNTDFGEGLKNWRLEHPAAGTRLGVNISREWTLEGRHTAFLEVDRSSAGTSVVYRDSLKDGRIKLKPSQLYRLRAHVGAHRCRGYLEIVFCDAGDRELGSARQEFGTHKGGGTRLDEYELLQIDFSPPRGIEHARIRLGYLGPDVPPREEEHGLSAFIFFTQFGLFAIEDSTTVVNWSDGWLDEEAADKEASAANRKRLYIAHIDADAANQSKTPIVIKSLADSRTEGVTIFSYGKSGRVRATIVGLDGALLKVSLQGAIDSICLYVDGVAVSSLGGIADQSTVLFPISSLLQDGRAHLVEVTDRTGLAIFARDYLILPYVQTPWSAIQQYAGGRLPTHLAPTASHRYVALQYWMERFDRPLGAPLDEEEAARATQIGYLHGVIARGHERIRDVRTLEFPYHASPEVSVVIPVLDNFALTYFCLCALLFAPSDLSFEVIVVDDGSRDRTLELGAVARNVTIVRNESTMGFIAACNRGAAHARGRYIVFLNNDTEPTAHWLDELRNAFEMFPDVGLAGAKLLYPDGRLQEAGGIVWRSGNPWNYGRGQNPHDSRFSYARLADYVSGAAIMIPKDLWDGIGGFSSELEVAYFEDTYLAFDVRSRGFKTVFVPTSIVYHMEGATSGNSVHAGAKRYQEINRPAFKRRWGDLYRQHGKEGDAPDLEKDRGIVGRVLFIDYQTPRPDIDAGSYAALQEMRLVQALGFKVTLIPENLAYLGHYTEQLQRMGIETVHAPFFLSLQDFLEQRGHEFDAVYMTRYGVVEKHLSIVRAHAPQAKVLFNLADLHFLRELRAALAASSEAHLNYALGVRERELAVIQRVDLTLSYNSVEEAVIVSHAPGKANVARCPWIVETQTTVAPFHEREGIAFLGGFAHPPNSEAVQFFVGSIMPKLRIALPGVRFHIYGSGVSKAIEALRAPDVLVHGYVESTAQVYDAARVFVAPLRSGAGIKGKVLGALAAGVPTVLSDLAAEGIGIERGRHYLAASAADEWVEAIRSLYLSETLWRSVSKAGHEFVRRHHSFGAGVELMRAAFERVGIFAFKEGSALCATTIAEPSFKLWRDCSASPKGSLDRRPIGGAEAASTAA